MAEIDTTNYQKYETGNPLMRRVIDRFLSRLCAHVQSIKPTRILDVGCGEGQVAHELSQLGFPFDYRGFDINPESVKVAETLNPQMRFESADLFAMAPEEDWADLAICLEVLEHLPNPREALEVILKWTRRHAIISVPWEPWFRTGNFLRGKYLTALGNHPEHIQQFTPRRLKRLADGLVSDVRIATCFPWIFAILTKGERRNG